nr:DUF3772 domain-containing protein [uncultured Shimia sp.]
MIHLSAALRIVFVVVLMALPGFGGVAAQETLDYDKWRLQADRAEEAIEFGRASDMAMEALRSHLVQWRGTFDQARTKQQISTDTLEAQLKALGPVPEDGEPEDAAQLRVELTERLAKSRAPTRRAELAFAEAEELIHAVDGVLRARQTDALMQKGPSPLNPLHWTGAFQEFSNTFMHVVNEVKTSWAYQARRYEIVENLPKMVFYLVLAAVLLWRGRFWTERLMRQVQQTEMSAGRWLVAFAVSLGYILLPLAGVYALIEAIYATDLAGLRGDRLLSKVPEAALIFLLTVWLGQRMFPKVLQSNHFLRLSEARRAEGRFDTFLIGLVLATNEIFKILGRFDIWSVEARGIIFFPLIVLAGLLMLRIASLLGAYLTQEREEERPDRSYGYQVIQTITRFYQICAVVGIALAITGFTRASEAIIFPAILSVQWIAFVFMLTRFLSHIAALLQGRKDSSDSLIPVLIALVLAAISLPVLALIWGARVADITEIWTKLARGLSIGQTTISPQDFVIFLAVFGLGYGITRLLQKTMRVTILPKTRLDIGGQNAVVSGIGYVGIFLAAMIAINNAGIDLGSIALVAGALSVGIGFGLQTIVSNFVSGIILLVERPVSEGDWIEVAGQMGYVRDISVRATRIETFDRTDVIVPNADLVTGQVTNYTRGNTVGRVIVPVGVAYGTDPRRIEKLLLEVANAHPMVLATPAPYVVFQGFGASSLDFEIRAILRDVNWVLSVRSDMNFEIARRFAEEDIEIPFAQTDIWLRNPETLARGRAETKPSNEPKHKVRVVPEILPQETDPMAMSVADMDGGDSDAGGDGGDGGDR